MNKKSCFIPADILLPDFSKIDGKKWATIACDQFTSQPEYWHDAEKIAKDSPSALNLILPEAYLDREDELLVKISESMTAYVNDKILEEHPATMIYIERVQSDGRVRRGVVGAVDLEHYDWHPGTETLVRATEGTVPERIPPRVKIRKKASLELPHIMLLLDDPERNIIEGIAARVDTLTPAYDFELMLGGGSIKAYYLDKAGIDAVTEGVAALSAPDAAKVKYNIDGKAPLALAVGDGNHSLATARAIYEELKAEIGVEAAMAHPARYALAELVNIHDEALDFEPIYRVIFNVEPEAFIKEFSDYCGSLSGNATRQSVKVIVGNEEREVAIPAPEHQLTVGTVQRFLDVYTKANPTAEVDYIHGEKDVADLALRPNTVSMIFDGMTKDQLFCSVICDGALPRKTFSMGHAQDKRYYIEARKITK